MEFVILSTALARVATHAIDRYMPERSAVELVQGLVGGGRGGDGDVEVVDGEGRAGDETLPDATDGSSSGVKTEQTGNETGIANTEAKDEGDDNSAEGLKRRIKQLRAEAAKLTSADTFLEYARKTREATRLEKRLRDEYGESDGELLLGGGMDVDKMARAMTDAMTKRATLSARRSISIGFLAKVIVKILLLMSLWYVFSYGRHSDSRGHVMYVDCRAVRPLAFLLPKKAVVCPEGDWSCAARPRDECAVSYLVAVAVCNSVIALIVDGLMAKLVHR